MEVSTVFRVNNEHYEVSGTGQKAVTAIQEQFPSTKSYKKVKDKIEVLFNLPVIVLAGFKIDGIFKARLF